MQLLILGSPTKAEKSNYRGTHRITPYYVEGLPENHPANQAFFWYCSVGDELKFIEDLSGAQNLVRAYKALEVPQDFEIVEITTDNTAPIIGKELFGYDISTGWFSLLGNGLEFESIENLPEDKNKRIPEHIEILTQLLGDYFRPQLNQYGLFIDHAVATYCLQCMFALQAFHPGLWEHDEVKFLVIGLWKVE